MTKQELRTQEIREALVATLRHARETVQRVKGPARWAGIGTWPLKHDLPNHLKVSVASVRRHLRALEAQGTIREVGSANACIWQYIADEDRQREAAAKDRREEAERLERDLAKHLGFDEDHVTVYQHTETLIHVDMATAKRLLDT